MSVNIHLNHTFFLKINQKNISTRQKLLASHRLKRAYRHDIEWKEVFTLELPPVAAHRYHTTGQVQVTSNFCATCRPTCACVCCMVIWLGYMQWEISD